MWPDTRIQELVSIELPIIQAPMAGANLAEMAIAVAKAGGLGSLPCALLTPDGLRQEFGAIPRSLQAPGQRQLLLPPPARAGPRP